jgi:tetratricopeptide (TPR) repeat protein
VQLTPESLEQFLSSSFRDREPADRETIADLAQELRSSGYTTLDDVSEMLGRTTEDLLRQERANPPNGKIGSRFTAAGAVRVSLAIAEPDRITRRAGAPAAAESDAMARGSELEAAGDLAAAEAAYRDADAGGVDASLAISRVCIERGDLDAMRRAFDVAIERGHLTAIFNTGVILGQRGDVVASEVAYRAADAAGDICASVNLGILLEAKGDLKGAEDAYRRADDAGDAEGACCLGMFLEDRWDIDGARSALQRAERAAWGAARRGSAYCSRTRATFPRPRRRTGGRWHSTTRMACATWQRCISGGTRPIRPNRCGDEPTNWGTPRVRIALVCCFG